MLFYFRTAMKFGIIDTPNHRSSHSHATIRGGGIIFPIAIFLQALFTGFDYPLFSIGLFLISAISFYDDLRPLSSKIRLLVHLIAVSLLFAQADLLTYTVWIIIPAYILVIGTINAYNFMDGINGITGAYSLITILSLYFINESGIQFVSNELLIITVLALLVFNCFNFRKKAKCFAGDVGSVSMAFIIIFFILLIILKTEDLKYIGLLLFYGLDTVSTIIFRLIRRENIFEAHRSHFYQYLANVIGWQHLWISTLYMIVQLMVNLLIFYSDWDSVDLLIFILVSGIVFAGLRFVIEGKRNLIGRH
jgi:UDP-N-acetylmuramyl pentapeptide phosphotransferase/UDP-N-acetylglucosamine-1-phosphate transferase